MNDIKFEIRPAADAESSLFFSQSREKDAELGCIGHVRMDFGHGGKEFWHTWHQRGPEELNSPAFQAELDKVVNELRKNVLKDFSSMTAYCRSNGGQISGGWVQNHGFIVDTENYRYCLRCNPVRGDYQAYLTCFDKQVQTMDQDAEMYQEIEIFDIPGLFSNWRIPDSEVPEGLYRYDLRGSDDDPGFPIRVEERVVVNHAGSILTAKPLEIPEEGFLWLTEEEGLNFTGGEMTAYQFREEHGNGQHTVEAESISDALPDEGIQMGGM